MAHSLPLVNTFTPEAATWLRATKSEPETQFLTNCSGTVYRLPSTDQKVEGSLMHVLVATDGKTDTDEAAKFAHAIAGSEGSTAVLTHDPLASWSTVPARHGSAMLFPAATMMSCASGLQQRTLVSPH